MSPQPSPDLFALLVKMEKKGQEKYQQIFLHICILQNKNACTKITISQQNHNVTNIGTPETLMNEMEL